MSKIIYYMGAGASYGKKEAREVIDKGTEKESLLIHEGLPVINEIGKCLLAFKEAVANAPIDISGHYSFLNKYSTSGDDLNHMRNCLITDIEKVYEANKEHATIDTYAKKLYLIKRTNELKRLKNVLTTFFVWTQVVSKTDQRYDTFLANILQENTLSIPNGISVISWNYDSQFEMAYRNYSQDGNLPIFDKKAHTDYQDSGNCGKIFKVNGSANFDDFCMVDYISKHTDVDSIIQLIEYYGSLNADTAELGFQFTSRLSYAWETSERQKQMFDMLQKVTYDTTTVIVIGYSFPYFNRQIDRKIFAAMPYLQSVYIQDPNPEAIEPSLRAVLLNESATKIVYQKDCTQFYLPREL